MGGLVGAYCDVTVFVAGDDACDEFGAEEACFGPFAGGFVEVLEEGGLVDVCAGEVVRVDMTFTNDCS